MTAKELIKFLSECEPEQTVIVATDEGAFSDFDVICGDYATTKKKTEEENQN